MALKEGDDLPVYHLTLDGKYPKTIAIKDLPSDVIFRIAFNGQILKKCPSYGDHWSFGNPPEHFFFVKGRLEYYVSGEKVVWCEVLPVESISVPSGLFQKLAFKK